MFDFNKLQETFDADETTIIIAGKPGTFEISTKNPYVFLKTFFLDGKRTPTDSNVAECCGHFARRSLFDLYKLTKTYFPKISLEELQIILYTLVKKEVIHKFFCGVVRKMMYGAPTFYFYDGYKHAECEFGITVDDIEQLVRKYQGKSKTKSYIPL